MSDIFALSTDQTILGPDGNRAANGQVHFYNKATGEYAPVYGDAGLSVSLRQPVQADSSGVLPLIYLDDAIAYRAVIADRKNNPIREIEDVRRHRPGIKVLGGIEALKRYCGNDPFVLVAAKGGCPVFYKRLSGCDLPEEKLPDVVRAECGCDCSIAWQLCRSEPDICAMETAELNCDYHVLVQECRREAVPDGTVKPDGSVDHCYCPEGPEAGPPPVKKASIGALLSAGAKCLPRTCIPHDAPELALVGGGLVQGDREPPPIKSSLMNGRFAGCIRIFVPGVPGSLHHVQLDGIVDLGNQIALAPQITLHNPGPCIRRYEMIAINRLHRARDLGAPFGGVPTLNANLQTRLGDAANPRLNDVYGVADIDNNLPWLTNNLPSVTALSIADSMMGPFLSGHLGSTGNDYPGTQATNGYTENHLVVDLSPGMTVTYALKYHVYWDINATAAQLALPERLHFGTRIIARQVH